MQVKEFPLQSANRASLHNHNPVLAVNQTEPLLERGKVIVKTS